MLARVNREGLRRLAVVVAGVGVLAQVRMGRVGRVRGVRRVRRTVRVGAATLDVLDDGEVGGYVMSDVTDFVVEAVTAMSGPGRVG